MEEKITKIVEKCTRVDNTSILNKNTKYNREIDQKKNRKPSINHLKDSKGNKYLEYENIVKKKNHQRESFSLEQRSSHLDKSTGKIFKKREQSFAVNLCFCETAKHVNKITHNQKQRSLKVQKSKISKHNIIDATSLKQSKPLMFSSSKGYYEAREYNCPSDICFHKIPSNRSIDDLLDNLKKIKGNIDYSIDGDKNNKKYYCSIPVNLSTVKSEIIKKHTKSKTNIPIYSVIAYNSNNKATDCVDMVPLATQSEYIAEINLDRSNDNTCKCKVKQLITRLNQGYGKDISSDDLYTCLNSETCNCIKYPEKSSNKLKRQLSRNIQPLYQKESQNFSLSLNQLPSGGCANKKSEQCLNLPMDSFVQDAINKLEIKPSEKFDVRFLGVTLKDTNKNNEASNISWINSPITPQSRCNLNNYKNRDLFQNIQSNKFKIESLTNNLSNIKENGQSKCVCCKENSISNDLEINVFNLLEEHLKGKLCELQRKCKFSSHLKEKELLISILQKVKEVISESTNPLTCSCTGSNDNDVSWSRAYGLLQEYIQLKIKRVQCSCDSKDQNVKSAVPKILQKVCDLIENDFRRLKGKYIFEKSATNFDLTQLDKQTSPVRQQFTEKFVQVDNYKNNNKELKHVDSISCQVSSHINAENKSCYVLHNEFQNIITNEKNISCDLTNVHVTDCECQNIQHYVNTEVFVNLYSECMPTFFMKDEKEEASKTPKTTLSALFSADNIKSKTDISVNNFEYPYFGYTLNCSCDRALGKCHCAMSMINASYKKIDYLWKSAANNRCYKKLSYIMSKVLHTVKSEPININEPCHSSGSSKLKIVTFSDKGSCTPFYKDIVLKKSKEKYEIFKNIASSTNNMYTDAYASNKHSPSNNSNKQQFVGSDKYSIDSEHASNKRLLYESLQLPTEILSKYNAESYVVYSNNNLDTASEGCECKMIPVCHVKMLIEDIEKKMIESKCTCDTLSSRICPIHSEEFCDQHQTRM